MVAAVGCSRASFLAPLQLLSLCGLCLLGIPPGWSVRRSHFLTSWEDQGNLMKPKNVQVHAVNTNFTLKWDWDGNCNVKDCNVTFSAYFNVVKKKPSRSWQKLSGCVHVSATICDFSSAKLDFLKKYKLRVKAEAGKKSSEWSSTIKFVPYVIAAVGPPSSVQIEAVDGSIKINISAPGSTDKTPMWEASDFSYWIEFWKGDNSTEQKQNRLVQYNDRIDNLEPNTTYCLKIKALLNAGEKEGAFSPTYCVHTESADVHKVAHPKNVRVHALNRNFVLKWDWDEAYGENVTFTVECCRAYRKKYSKDSVCWEPVPKCERVTTSECDLSSEIIFEGEYEFRVRAISGTDKTAWSKEIKFTPSRDTEIGPPSKVEVKLIDGSITLEISHPGEDGNKSMKNGFPDLSYRVFTWKNSSDAWEMRFEEERTHFTISKSELDPETLYCVKVQAFSYMSNKTGNFSAARCITTKAGKHTYIMIAAIFFSTVFAFIVVIAICYTVYRIYQWIKYVFFPSCTLPSNIEECFHEVSLTKSFLSYEAEPTEKCSITMNIVTENTDETDDKNYAKHCVQSSVDSGNYSNEDEVNEGPQEKLDTRH